jgi:hypothetical protein
VHLRAFASLWRKKKHLATKTKRDKGSQRVLLYKMPLRASSWPSRLCGEKKSIWPQRHKETKVHKEFCCIKCLFVHFRAFASLWRKKKHLTQRHKETKVYKEFCCIKCPFVHLRAFVSLWRKKILCETKRKSISPRRHKETKVHKEFCCIKCPFVHLRAFASSI